ncbi:MAG: glutamyl-tRNA reductase, partial [Pseudomonadota bacterium]|nr:glutamyl-tRNA reductase [Pseudomonadota bacterium]
GDIHGDLKDVGVLVIGLGEIADLIVRQLKAAGAGQIALTGNGRRAEREAQALGYRYLPMEELDQGLVRADITVTAAGLGKYLVDKEAVDRALRSRRYRPMLFLDGGLPNDIEPEVHDLGDAFVYTLDDLEQVAQRGRMQREAVAREAWAIVDAEVACWTAGLAAREAAPAVVALRAHFENLRQDVLTEQPHVSADEATRLLINRLLHAPTVVLRELATQGDTKQTTDALVRRLFALDENDTTEKEE